MARLAATARRGVRAAQRVRHDLRVRRFVQDIPGIRDLTMVGLGGLTEMVRFVDEVVADGIDGAVVECGVWRGGVSFAAARRLQHHGDDRPVWMFDSFEGLPPPAAVDGPRAKTWMHDAHYHDNCAAALDQVRFDADALGVQDRVRLVAGWFDDTLPATRDEVGPIALLRIDADWHASVRCCLDELYDQVSPGGIVVFDDYYSWDGCAVAVHEFLGQRALAHRLRTGAGSGASFHKV